MKFDYTALRNKIKEDNIKHYALAKEINLSQRALSCKLNNKVEFRQSEILRICEVLNIPNIQVGYYFYKVQE